MLEEPQEVRVSRGHPVLVTGAAGFVGTHLIRQLAARGWKVRALVRDPMKAAARLADTSAELRVGDLRDPDALASAVSGTGAVVHLAAIAMERGADTYESVNTDATQQLLEATRAAGTRRWIFMSQNGASDTAESRFLRSKGVAERLVRESGLEWTVIRPSVIFGSEDEFANVVARLVRISPLVLPLPDGGSARFQPIAVDDVAATVALCLERRDTIHGSFDIGGPAQLSLRDMAERILLAMGARRSIVGIPRGALRPFVALMQNILPSPPVTTTLLDLLGSDNVIEHNALGSFVSEPKPFAPQELAYLRRITIGEAVKALFR